MLTSPTNERVKYARSLQRERVRTRERLFLIEGIRLIEEALRAGVRPVLAFYTERLLASARGQALAARLQEASATALLVSEPVLASLSDTVTPQGVLAAVPYPELPLPSHGLLVVLDGLRDPGNVGTILRTAWAADAAGLVTTRGTTDPYAPKVARAAMGAHFHLPLRAGLTSAELDHVLTGRRALLAERGGQPYWQVDWRGDCALIVGGEARGSELAAPLAQDRVGIPMRRDVESLNAAIAAAVLLFEAVRQRTGLSRPLPPASGVR